MDFKKINEELKEFDYNNFEVSQEDLSEIEIELLRKNILKNKKLKNRKKKVIAAAAAIMIIGTVASPAVAKNIPILTRVYEALGIFDGYEDYTKYIGLSQNAGEYVITIEDMAVSKTKSTVSIKIEGTEKIRNDVFFSAMVANSGVSSSASNTRTYQVDDKTVIIAVEVRAIDGEFDAKQKFEIAVNEIDESKDDDEIAIETISNFNFKADFTNFMQDQIEIPINKSCGNYDFKEIVSNKTGTELVANIKNIVYDENFVPMYLNDKIYIIVDGVAYSTIGGSISDSGIYRCEFENLTSEIIENAKSIDVSIATETEEKFIKEKEIKEENISFVKEKKTESGEKIALSKIQKIDNNIKLTYTGKLANQINLASISLWEGNEKYARPVYGKSFYEGDNYIIEFKDVKMDADIAIRDFTNAVSKEVGKIKVK